MDSVKEQAVTRILGDSTTSCRSTTTVGFQHLPRDIPEPPEGSIPGEAFLHFVISLTTTSN